VLAPHICACLGRSLARSLTEPACLPACLPTPTWRHHPQGIKLGVSSRGWASLRTDPEDGLVYVDDDFELITFDFVTEPSNAGAFLVPLAAPYHGRLPSQAKATQVGGLGSGWECGKAAAVAACPVHGLQVRGLQSSRAGRYVGCSRCGAVAGCCATGGAVRRH
jgi:hypothetical protein